MRRSDGRVERFAPQELEARSGAVYVAEQNIAVMGVTPLLFAQLGSPQGSSSRPSPKLIRPIKATAETRAMRFASVAEEKQALTRALADSRMASSRKFWRGSKTLFKATKEPELGAELRLPGLEDLEGLCLSLSQVAKPVGKSGAEELSLEKQLTGAAEPMQSEPRAEQEHKAYRRQAEEGTGAAEPSKEEAHDAAIARQLAGAAETKKRKPSAVVGTSEKLAWSAELVKSTVPAKEMAAKKPAGAAEPSKTRSGVKTTTPEPMNEKSGGGRRRGELGKPELEEKLRSFYLLKRNFVENARTGNRRQEVVVRAPLPSAPAVKPTVLGVSVPTGAASWELAVAKGEHVQQYLRWLPKELVLSTCRELAEWMTSRLG